MAEQNNISRDKSRCYQKWEAKKDNGSKWRRQFGKEQSGTKHKHQLTRDEISKRAQQQEETKTHRYWIFLYSQETEKQRKIGAAQNILEQHIYSKK
jgi:hypothetical protein